MDEKAYEVSALFFRFWHRLARGKDSGKTFSEVTMDKRKIIIDCDPGIDDSLALMLALASPEVEVVGITIVCGNSPVELGRDNALRILSFMDRLDVPV